MERIHLDQAKLWLDGATHIAASGGENSQRYTVASAMAIHAVIKANDALTSKFLGLTARRHDDARRHFEDLVKKGFIRPEHASYRQIIQDAIDNKSRAEYRVASFSKRDFEELRRKAEKFIAMAAALL